MAKFIKLHEINPQSGYISDTPFYVNIDWIMDITPLKEGSILTYATIKDYYSARNDEWSTERNGDIVCETPEEILELING